MLMNNDEMKMILVVRKDLKMGNGKVAAQCAHAAVAAVELCRSSNDQQWKDWLDRWFSTGMKKVVLQIPDEPSLSQLKKQCEGTNVPTIVIRDAGRTQIAAGSKTVLAIGPAPAEKVSAFTKELKLL